MCESLLPMADLLDSLPFCVLIVDGSHRIRFANLAAREAVGLSQEALMGKSCPKVFHDCDGPFDGCPLEESVATGGPIEKEVFIAPDRWYLSSVYPTSSFGEDGKRLYVHMSHDITEKKNAESLATTAENGLADRLETERLISGISTRLISLDSGDLDSGIEESLGILGKFCGVDRAYIFLLSEDGTLLDNTHEWCSEGTVPQIGNLKGLRVETFPWWMSELRALRTIHVPDVGSMPGVARAEREILEAQEIKSVLVVPLTVRGTLLGFMGFDAVNKGKTWDVDDIMLLKTAGEIFIKSIEHVKSEEALKSSQVQLWQAQKMESLGRLAGGVTHDFNNLLTIILGYSDLLLMNAGGDESLKRMAMEIKNAGKMGSQLTRQLLAFSRKQVVKQEELELNDTVSRIEGMLRSMLGEDVRLSTSLHPQPCRVLANRGQMEQVLINLAANAKDAMPGGGELAIRVGEMEMDERFCRLNPAAVPGKYVKVEVCDTGEGMSMDVKSHLFEPFFTTKESGKGTGLGLSTVFGIVKQNSGYIDVSSEPGKGSRFTVYLPRIVPKKESEKRPTSQIRRVPGGETVLVVEDEYAVRILVATILRDNGYKAIEAENGEMACEIMRDSRAEIHLLLTDIMMPGMKGGEVAAAFLERRPWAKVLLMSGDVRSATESNEVMKSRLPFIQKPFTMGELVAKVREVLDA